MAWVDAMDAADLAERGKAVVRVEGRQILVLQTADGLRACSNRCPHEGYPLSEGTMSGSEGCILTCNWHNWKFDLTSGETLIGGDKLTRYPAKLENGRIWLEIGPIDRMARRAEILSGLPKALADEDLQRLAREGARLELLGLDPLDAVRVAVDWVAERREFGTSHAHAVAVDWLELRDRPETPPDAGLAALAETLGYFAETGRTDRKFPFPEGQRPWSTPEFLAAIENEDESVAIPLLRGALAAGLTAEDLYPTFLEAALSHYADFGHSLIYTVKIRNLASRLGPQSFFALLAPLTRSLIMAGRDDLLPEFREYHRCLVSWGKPLRKEASPDPVLLRRTTAKAAMAMVASWSATHSVEAIFAALVEAGAWQLLHVDEVHLNAIDIKIADTVAWLDFTHTLTFAEAGLRATASRPDLWPALLLQLACFLGRNSSYCDPRQSVDRFAVQDSARFIERMTTGLFDHGRDHFILSAHLVKTLGSAARLSSLLPAQGPINLASVNRFLTAPMKRRHILRTARQMRAFVAEE